MMRAKVLFCIALLALSTTGCSSLGPIRSNPENARDPSSQQKQPESEHMYEHAHRAAATSLASIAVGLTLGYVASQSAQKDTGDETLFAIGAGVAGLVAFISGEVAIFSTIKAGQLSNQEWRQAIEELKQQEQTRSEESHVPGPIPGHNI